MDRKEALMMIARTVLVACMVARQELATVQLDTRSDADARPLFAMMVE